MSAWEAPEPGLPCCPAVTTVRCDHRLRGRLELKAFQQLGKAQGRGKQPGTVPKNGTRARPPAPGAGGFWCCKLGVSQGAIVTSPFKITPYRSPNRAPEGLYARAFSQKSRFTQPNHRYSCSGIGGEESLNFPPPSLSSHFCPVSGLFWSGLHLIVTVCDQERGEDSGHQDLVQTVPDPGAKHN